MKIRTITMGLIAGSLMAAPFAVSAKPCDKGHMRDGKKCEMMWKDLKLKDDQKTKLKELHQKHRESLKPLFEEMKSIRGEIKKELLKENSAPATLNGLAKKLGGIHQQMTEKRGKHLLEVKAILSPDQFAKLLERDRRGPPCRGKKENCPFDKKKKRGAKK